MKKLILALLLVPTFVIAADKVYLECGETRYTMESDKNECSAAGSDYSLGISKSVCFRWDPDTITITSSTEFSKYVYIKSEITNVINRETLEMTVETLTADKDGVRTTPRKDAGVCKIVEKNTKNKL